MNYSVELKITLYKKVLSLISERRKSIQSEIDKLSISASAEVKSSMGDKYETSREMINLEKGKLAEQLAFTEKMLATLKNIDPENIANVGELGALVITTSGNYFLAVALGKISLKGLEFYVVSPVSPIGQQLLNKKIGQELNFRATKAKITSIL